MGHDEMGGMGRNFEDMSNADLVAFIGGDVDLSTDRADLIMMAKEAERNRRKM